MLQTLINQFTTAFSRSFWFGSFLPVLVVAFLHALLVAFVFEPDWLSLDAVLTLGAETAPRMTLLFVLIVLAAYVIAPFVPLFRGIVDATLLPRWLHNSLRGGRRGSWREAAQAYRAARDRSARADNLVRRLPELAQARQDARSRLPQTGEEKKAADEKIAAAEAAVGALTSAGWRGFEKSGRLRQWWQGRLERTSEEHWKFEAAAKALKSAFEVHTASRTASEVHAASADRLDKAHARYTILVRERAVEDRHCVEVEARRNAYLDLLGWQATRLGDVRRATETYSEDTYGADYEWLWPRLALALPEADTGLARRVTDANAQLNFAILLLALFQTIPLVWLPVLFFTGEDLWLLLLIGWLAPLVNLGLYELVVQSQAAFGSVVHTAIDDHRFDVLKRLHQALPVTLSAERQLWKKLVRARERGAAIELTYERAPQG